MRNYKNYIDSVIQMMVNFSYHQAIHFKQEKWLKGEYAKKEWFPSKLRDYLLTIATPDRREAIVEFIEAADATFIVSI